MKIVFFALCIFISSANAKTVQQTSTWLERQFPPQEMDSAPYSFNSFVQFDSCAITRNKDYFNQSFQHESFEKFVELDHPATGKVLLLEVDEMDGRDRYQITLSKKSVTTHHYKSGLEPRKDTRLVLFRKQTSPDMPDRILKALSHLITQCTGSPPDSLRNLIVEDDLF